VHSILAASGLAHDKQVAEQEALALQRLSPDEIRARQAELVKMRNLLFYHELKAKRAAKIKSKAYGRAGLQAARGLGRVDGRRG